ncbi:MAG: YitT family protein [Eubacterium sp.]|nr:YitT family protein [Eubacterium sp.]
MKTRILRILRTIFIDCLSGLLIGISVQVFTVHADFAPGGLNGIAIIINYLTRLPIGLLIILLNIPIVLFSYRVLGRKYLLYSIKSMLIGSFFMDHVAVHFPVYTGDRMMAALFAGVIGGIGYAVLYLSGSCTGGTDFLIMSMKKLKPYLSLSHLIFLISGCVLAAVGLVYHNIDAVLYGLISTYVASTVIEKIMYGAESGKLALIVTTKGKEICEAINNNIRRGSTILPAYGGYKQDRREVVLCVCGRQQAATIKTLAEKTDPDAFLIVSEFNEVFGEGFSPFED